MRVFDDLDVIGLEREHVGDPFARDGGEIGRETIVIFDETKGGQAISGGNLILDAKVDRAGLQALLEPVDLVDKVRVPYFAERLSSAARRRPNHVFHVLDQRLAFWCQADLFLAVVALHRRGAGEAEFLQAGMDSGDSGLADADSFNRFCHAKRTIDGAGREQREMGRQDRSAGLRKGLGGVSLQALG